MEARGIVLDEDRGSLPFMLIHGEALVAAAAWSLGEAGVVLVDADVGWAALAESLAESGEPLVLHDPLCPMTPPHFIAACIERAVELDAVVVGVRPVTDTVKAVTGDVFAETVDRDRLLAIASPVVLPARVAGELDGLPTTDLAGLVGHLRSRWSVEMLEAPPEARRVGSEDELRVLEALTSAGSLRPGSSGEA